MGLQQFILNNIKILNIYPPYLGAGIYLEHYTKDFMEMKVSMKDRWYNRNLFGTHFGGSLYSMCDPFFVFMIMQNLGKGYIVWDKAASINFKKPGKGKVSVTFTLSPEQLQHIKDKVIADGKGNFEFSAQILNQQNEVVAEVTKVIYVKGKQAV